jgi:hypothetical protein
LRREEFIIERTGKPLAALDPDQMRRLARRHALETFERRAREARCRTRRRRISRSKPQRSVREHPRQRDALTTCLANGERRDIIPIDET